MQFYSQIETFYTENLAVMNADENLVGVYIFHAPSPIPFSVNWNPTALPFGIKYDIMKTSS